MELIRSKSSDELTLGEQTTNTPDLPSGEIVTNLVNIDQAQPSLYQFEVKVDWSAPGGQKSVEAATLINPQALL